jgi:hypothetical protein
MQYFITIEASQGNRTPWAAEVPVPATCRWATGGFGWICESGAHGPRPT